MLGLLLFSLAPLSGRALAISQEIFFFRRLVEG